jgi:hypothetical protein
MMNFWKRQKHDYRLDLLACKAAAKEAKDEIHVQQLELAIVRFDNAQAHNKRKEREQRYGVTTDDSW